MRSPNRVISRKMFCSEFFVYSQGFIVNTFINLQNHSILTLSNNNYWDIYGSHKKFPLSIIIRIGVNVHM